MQNARVPLSTASSRISEVRHTREAANCPHQFALELRSEDQFIAMLNAYRASGGLAPAQELIALFQRCRGPSVATLVNWIIEREVICFEWRSQAWLPLFQFDRTHLQPDAKIRPIVQELVVVYDQWDMGAWFARPNPWIEGRTPVDALRPDFSEVLNAARADRFVTQG